MKDKVKEFKWYNKYEVTKLDDIDKYLDITQKLALNMCIEVIQEGRYKDGKKRCNSYVVVNQEEPYAEDVWMLIEKGKSLKELLSVKDVPVLKIPQGEEPQTTICNHCAYMVAQRDDTAMRVKAQCDKECQERIEGIFKEADEPCVHTSSKTPPRKRECIHCWQALKEKG